MSDLAYHLLSGIQKDAEALCAHGDLTRKNLLLIESILKNPSRDYEVGDANSHAPAYTLIKNGSDVSMSDRPLPPRYEAPKPSLPARPRTSTDSPPVPSRARPYIDSSQQFKEPAKPTRPPVPAPYASKPVGNDKLTSQYRSEQEKKQESNDKQNQLASRLGNQAVMSGASGLGWGVGVGVARHMI
jgi:hypothetical protein